MNIRLVVLELLYMYWETQKDGRTDRERERERDTDAWKDTAVLIYAP
jgi:hypothetical protein